MTHIANMIAELRVLVALLGEQQQAGWWASQFYSPTATAFLAPIFHRSLFQAQYQGATAAAAKAHESQQATAIYARLDLDPVRASVNTATSAMLEAGGMKAAAEVGPINSERLKA